MMSNNIYEGLSLRKAFGILALILSLAGSAGAATLTVNASGGADYTRITDAIDNASAGDTILVNSGTYYENIKLKDGIKLYGEGANITIIDGKGSGNVVMVASNSIIDGFTITNGIGPGFAGIHSYGSSTTITNNIIQNNSIGIYSEGPLSSPLIEGNVIRNNTGYASNEVCTIGTGIQAWDSSNPLIENNIIVYNSNGIRSGMSSPTIINNVIHGNQVGNLCDPEHAGVLMYSGSAPLIKNNIITGNERGIWSQLSFPVIFNNDVWNNTNANYVDVSPGGGDISINPLFKEPYIGDYHLLAGSPCIDTGNNTEAPSIDFDGNPRPIDGDGDGIAIVDMGVYEYIPMIPPPPVLELPTIALMGLGMLGLLFVVKKKK